MNHTRDRMCTGKVRHRSKRKALKALKVTGEYHGDLTLYAYPCHHCKGWHVGHPDRAARTRLGLRRMTQLIDRALRS